LLAMITEWNKLAEQGTTILEEITVEDDDDDEPDPGESPTPATAPTEGQS